MAGRPLPLWGTATAKQCMCVLERSTVSSTASLAHTTTHINTPFGVLNTIIEVYAFVVCMVTGKGGKVTRRVRKL